ncbi:hypothetical protein R3P38DRAFT_3215412 [Favolaschia claudopus]|uniref:Ribonuclease H1 N-terminal domain-containing protein n=1 Tax=Favolaschia claudopus TaxID=2862362 RepID=A0AAW0A7I3_9AGAR
MSSSLSTDMQALADARSRDIADAIPDLTPTELRTLLSYISDDRLKEVVLMIGASALATQLDPALAKLLRLSAPPAPLVSRGSATVPKAPAGRSASRVSATTTASTAPRAPTSKGKAKKKETVPVVDIPSDSPPSTPPQSPPPSSSPAPASTPYTFPPVRMPVQSQAAGLYHYYTPDGSGFTDDYHEACALTANVPHAVFFQSGSAVDRSAYVLLIGAPEVGVYDNVAALKSAVESYPKAVYCGFPSRTAAEEAWTYARARGWTGDSVPLTLPTPKSDRPQPLAAHYPPSPLNVGTSWYTVTRGVNPGVYASYFESQLNVWNVPKASRMKYVTRALAEAAYERALAMGHAAVVLRR